MMTHQTSRRLAFSLRSWSREYTRYHNQFCPFKRFGDYSITAVQDGHASRLIKSNLIRIGGVHVVDGNKYAYRQRSLNGGAKVSSQLNSLNSLLRLNGRPSTNGTAGAAGALAFSQRSFQTSAKRDALPLIPAALAILKSSTALSILTTVTRIAITLFPVTFFSRMKVGRALKFLNIARERTPINPSTGVADISTEQLILKGASPRKLRHLNSAEAQTRLKGFEIYIDGKYGPAFSQEAKLAYARGEDGGDNLLLREEIKRLKYLDDKEEHYNAKQNKVTFFMSLLIAVPAAVFFLVVLAGLERTPVTGRWRVVLISPAEEEVITSSLLEKGWYQAVLEVLMPTPESPEVKVLPISDWRWIWVRDTLRKLEAGANDIVKSVDANQPYEPHLTADGSIPPPPIAYPLHPRPRVSSFIHSHMPPPSNDPSAHEESNVGPPYSLLLVDKDEANAFSFGFGGSGAGGIVVYTGILDEILGVTSEDKFQSPPQSSSPPPPQQRQQSSFLSLFFPPLITQPSPRQYSEQQTHTEPTEEQTLHLALLLSHEMSHLLLSHHLESLSNSSVLLPSCLNLFGDMLRTFLYPITVLGGPFLNDAIANFTKTITAKDTGLAELSEDCSSRKLEVEADIVGLRILSASGFNPYYAEKFWSSSLNPTPSSTNPSSGEEQTSSPHHFRGSGSHPLDKVRANAVRDELSRWSKHYEKAVKKAGQQQSAAFSTTAVHPREGVSEKLMQVVGQGGQDMQAA